MWSKLSSRRAQIGIGGFLLLVVVICLQIWLHEWVPLVLIVVELVLIGLVGFEIYHLRLTRGKVDDAVEAMDMTVKTIERHVETIASSVRLLERDKIYFYLAETARNAKYSVHHLSLAHSSLEISEDEERKRVYEFLEALRAASEKLDDVKILGPDLSAKIGGLWERKKVGCAVRVSPAVSNYDIRIQIVDGATVVIGVGAPSTRSESGFLIESILLARMLEDNFLALWQKKDTIALEEHTVKVVMRQVVMIPLPIGRLQDIMKDELHASLDDVKSILEMLQGKHLVCNETDVYRRDLIEDCRNLPTGTPEKVREIVAAAGGDISENGVEKLMKLLARDQAASAATPPSGSVALTSRQEGAEHG